MVFSVDNLGCDEKFALFYGIMLGDGCLSLVNGKKKFITITGSLDDDLPFFEKIVSPLLEFFREKKTNIKFRKDCRAVEFNFHDRGLFDLISSEGFPVGKKGVWLSIPETFYEKRLLNYVVAGFFATDGSLVLTKNPNKFYPRIESRVTHKDLVVQVFDYLKKLGMKGNHYFCKSRPDFRWKSVQNQYRFQFNGKKNLLLFNEKVGFVNPKHKFRFDSFLKYDGLYSFSKMERVNSEFLKNMAAPGTEPGTSSS